MVVTNGVVEVKLSNGTKLNLKQNEVIEMEDQCNVSLQTVLSFLSEGYETKRMLD